MVEVGRDCILTLHYLSHEIIDLEVSEQAFSILLCSCQNLFIIPIKLSQWLFLADLSSSNLLHSRRDK